MVTGGQCAVIVQYLGWPVSSVMMPACFCCDSPAAAACSFPLSRLRRRGGCRAPLACADTVSSHLPAWRLQCNNSAPRPTPYSDQACQRCLTRPRIFIFTLGGCCYYSFLEILYNQALVIGGNHLQTSVPISDGDNYCH